MRRRCLRYRGHTPPIPSMHQTHGTNYLRDVLDESDLLAPLLIGCDVRNMTKETMEILSYIEIIAINQVGLKCAMMQRGWRKVTHVFVLRKIQVDEGENLFSIS